MVPAFRPFTEMVQVPGCWQGQGFGNDSLDEVWDFQLHTRTLRATYKGTGWYAKRFEVSQSWSNKRIFLNFGGAHPSAAVWLNGTMLGENTLPFVPFGFEVTDLVRFGATNTVVVRVHEQNRVFGFGIQLQGNWSGLYRGRRSSSNWRKLTGTSCRFIPTLTGNASRSVSVSAAR